MITITRAILEDAYTTTQISAPVSHLKVGIAQSKAVCDCMALSTCIPHPFEQILSQASEFLFLNQVAHIVLAHYGNFSDSDCERLRHTRCKPPRPHRCKPP